MNQPPDERREPSSPSTSSQTHTDDGHRENGHSFDEHRQHHEGVRDEHRHDHEHGHHDKHEHHHGHDHHHGHEPAPKPATFEIRIDRTTYTVHQHSLTGAQLRQLSSPHIGQDRDLFEVVPGSSDLKIEAEAKVEMRNGLRFFTAPAQINPGRD